MHVHKIEAEVPSIQRRDCASKRCRTSLCTVFHCNYGARLRRWATPCEKERNETWSSEILRLAIFETDVDDTRYVDNEHKVAAVALGRSTGWAASVALAMDRPPNGTSPSANGNVSRTSLQHPPFSNGSTSLLQARSHSVASSTASTPRTRIYRCPTRDRPLYSVKGYTIVIHASDGDPNYWPLVTDPQDSQRPPQGHQAVNQDDPIYAVWNSRLAKALAKSLDLGDPAKDWILAGWPEGYRMFRRYDLQATVNQATEYIWSRWIHHLLH